MAKRKYRKYDSVNKIIDEIYSDFCVVCVNHFISKQAVYDMAYNASWELTEFNGKYKGCKYWTKEALDLYKDENQLKSDSALQKHLVHEHVIPKKFLIDYIMRCYKTNSKPDKKYFDLIIACVVTKEENKKLDKYKSSMPGDIKDIEDITEINRWERYIQSKISDIREVKWDNARNYESDEEVYIKYS